MKRMAVSMVVTLITNFSILAADLVHNPSGITFPANIEHRFTLGPVEDGAADAKKLNFYYLYPDGRRVIVNVYPAPKEARGPTLLEGDSKSEATPAFMQEFENLKNKYLKKDDSLAIRAQMRFRAAPQQGGVLGMKVTLAGTTTFTDLALFERNGYFVSLAVSYPADAWLSYGMTYTDVAHFIKWPKISK
jgi:hypothetical protein